MSTFHTARRNSSKTSIRRKYLGDPSDPHYTPESPIITRQSFTFEEEEELTRACTLVLSGVPHSDNDDEDPLMKYLSTQIIPKPTRTYHQKDGSTFSKSSIGAGSEYSYRAQRIHRINEDTATPSVTSKRDTLDRTNTSTPMTFLSETLRRPSSTRQNSGLRSDSKCSTRGHGIYEIAEQPGAIDVHGRAPAGNKSTTFIPSSLSGVQQHPTCVVAGKLGNICISHVEINKSLPNLPDSRKVVLPEKQSRGLSRMFKTNQKLKPDPIMSGALYGRPYESQLAQTAPINVPAKRSKFGLTSLFDRRRKDLIVVL